MRLFHFLTEARRKSKLRRRLEREARNKPGGWVYELDWDYGDNYVPPEAIKAGWKVGDDGRLTGETKENDDYRPIIHLTREPREYMKRAISPSMFGQWVVEIDPEFDRTFPAVPEEGQIGSWYIDQNGRFTDLFRPNPHFKGDFSKVWEE